MADVAEDHGADRVLVEVEGEALRATLELQQLVDGAAGQPADAGDAVADLSDASDLLLEERGREPVEPLAQRGGDVVEIDGELGHVRSLP